MLALTGLTKQVDTRSIFFAWLISVLNACVGYLLYEHAYYKDNGEFYKIVLGGHGIRALFILVSIIILLVTKLVSRVEFIWSFVALYFTHLAVEISAYQKKNQFEKRAS